MRSVNDAGVNLVISFEGLKLHPYLDSVGIPTIGYGTTKYPDGRKVSLGDHEITENQAREYLRNEINIDCADIDKVCHVHLNDNEFAALACFAYNIGIGALNGSTLLKMLNANQDRQAVADQFLRWNKAGGKEIPGLTRRRQAERSLFLHPVDNPPASGDTDVQLS